MRVTENPDDDSTTAIRPTARQRKVSLEDDSRATAVSHATAQIPTGIDD